MKAHAIELEFSRLVHRDEVIGDEAVFDIEAGREEREALAARFGLVALDRLTATARVLRTGEGKALRARVNFIADVIQSCVVTLEPVSSRIEESFQQIYVPETEIPAEAEVALSHDDEEPPEALRDDGFDLGEAVAEHLALSLDTYPRKPGVSLESALKGAERDDGGEEDSPFAALRRLKRGA